MEWQRVVKTGFNSSHGTPNRLCRKIMRYRSSAPVNLCTYCSELLICYMFPPISSIANQKIWPSNSCLRMETGTVATSSNIPPLHGSTSWITIAMVTLITLPFIQEWINPPTVYHHAMNFPSAPAGLQFYARAARCHGTLLREGRRSLRDASDIGRHAGVGLDLAMGSINLSRLEDSNVIGDPVKNS